MKDTAVVEAFERVMRHELAAAYGTPDRAFQREKSGNGWRYWCAGTEAAYEKFLAGWTAATLAQQSSGQDREDAERLKYLLSKVCMVQAATYGCKFEVINLPPHFGDCETDPIPPFLKAIDAARAAAKGE